MQHTKDYLPKRVPVGWIQRPLLKQQVVLNNTLVSFGRIDGMSLFISLESAPFLHIHLSISHAGQQVDAIECREIIMSFFGEESKFAESKEEWDAGGCWAWVKGVNLLGPNVVCHYAMNL